MQTIHVLQYSESGCMNRHCRMPRDRKIVLPAHMTHPCCSWSYGQSALLPHDTLQQQQLGAVYPIHCSSVVCPGLSKLRSDRFIIERIYWLIEVWHCQWKRANLQTRQHTVRPPILTEIARSSWTLVSQHSYLLLNGQQTVSSLFWN